MIVRDFEERDVAPACALTNHYIVNTSVHFGYTPYSPDEFRPMWTEGKKSYPWLAAEIDGLFAGYAKAGRWRERDAYRFTAEVGLYISDQFHRRGVGRALYSELFARLRKAGIHTVIGGVTMPNEGSVALHESMGFTKIGIFKEVGRKFDQWHDVGFWQLQL
jgi:L-amino acid N-acyltransferase YncA